MKKLVVIIILAICSLSIANAQFTKIGGGLVLSNGFPFHNMDYESNRSGKIAISFKGIYEITVPIHVSPSFTLFYPNITKDLYSKTSVATMMFDINGHYVFNSLDRFEFYGLSGLDILLTRKKNTYSSSLPTLPGYPTTNPYGSTTTSTESDNALGLNVGAGTYMKITEQIDIYAETKYVISKYDYFMLNVGALINLDWLKKNDN